MTKKMMLIVLVLVCLVQLANADPVGTAFTYQGQLYDANYPANGSYDFSFKLYDADSDGNKVGIDVNVADVDVADGYFTVELDFGSDVFDGEARWLEVGVRPGDLDDPNGYTALMPRQEVTPAPYALYTENSSGDSDWIISGDNMYSGVSGNVGVGTTEPGSYKLNVNGDMYATSYYGDGSHLAGITVSDDAISQAKLETATGEVSNASPSSTSLLILPGGEYGFYPQTKTQNNAACDNRIQIVGAEGMVQTTLGTTYITYITITYGGIGNAGTVYAQQRYVTASGQDHWLFLLVDKGTKDIISAYSAPDHPAYGNGGDFDKLPHPFPQYDRTKHEIVLLDKTTCEELEQEGERTGKSILALVNEEYEPKMDSEEVYQPLHSGKFLTENGEQVKQMVQSIPPYIKVRKLEKLTEQDKRSRKVIRQQKIQKVELDKQKKEQDKQAAINKLKALGLSETEVFALIEKK